MQSGAVFAVMVVKGHGPYALAVASEPIKFTGQEKPDAQQCDINTPQGTSAIASIMERVNYDVEARVRTLRVRCEEVHSTAEKFDHKVLLFFLRHAAWQIRTSWSWQMETPARKVQWTTLRGKIAEFVENRAL